VTYLGANLPGLEIAAAAVRTGARAVALSVIHPDDDPALGSQMEALRRSLPAGVTLLVGGAAAAAYRVEVEAAQGQVVTELAELRSALRGLASGT
jgi:methylmalonyl-CoA mutase cobalamin-binding subunit